MKLPDGCPFVVLDFVHTDRPVARITEDFVDWLVRDCAAVCADIDDRGEWGAAADVCKRAILSRYGLEEKE